MPAPLHPSRDPGQLHERLLFRHPRVGQGVGTAVSITARRRNAGPAHSWSPGNWVTLGAGPTGSGRDPVIQNVTRARDVPSAHRRHKGIRARVTPMSPGGSPVGVEPSGGYFVW